MSAAKVYAEFASMEEIQEAEEEIQRKRAAHRAAVAKTSRLVRRVAAVELVVGQATGNVAIAAAEELAELKRELVKAQGNSDKILREVDELTSQIDRRKLLRKWCHG